MIALALASLFTQGLSPESFGLPPLPIVAALATGDLDGDGDLDLVGTGGPGNTFWCENLGDRFRMQEIIEFGTSSIGRLKVACADFDSDGDDDVVVTGYPGPAVGWLESLGNGEFSPVKPIDIGNVVASELTVADFDGDGRIDIGVYDLNNFSVQWYRSLPTGGFAPRSVIHANQFNDADLVSGDLDSDGDPDLLYRRSSADTLTIARNDGGTFSSPITVLPDAIDARKVRLADVDGDGAVDVVATLAANRRISWARNTGGLTFAPFVTAYDPPGRIREHLWGDIDGDGLVDVVVCQVNGNETVWLRNLGGSFASPTLVPTDRSLVRGGVIADVDLDGRVDLFLHGADRVELCHGVPGGFEAPRRVALRLKGEALVAVGDLDGDGVSDMVVADDVERDSFSWYPGVAPRVDGAVSFAGERERFGMDAAATMSILDVNGDGQNDIVAVGRDEAAGVVNVGWAAQLVTGEFEDAVVLQSESSSAASRQAFGDADADGDLDLLFSWESAQGVWESQWSLQVAPGVFVNGPTLTGDQIDGAFRLGDVDGDGDADVVRYDPTGSPTIVWDENDGTGSLVATTTVSPSTFTVTGLGVADLDGDGRSDVVVFDAAGTGWHRSLPGGGFDSAQPLVPARTAPVQGRLVDVDSDGVVDVLVSSAGAPSEYVRGLGAGMFAAAEALLEAEVGSRALDAVDFDGDRDKDVAKFTPDGGLAWNASVERLGRGYCGPANLNSSGGSAWVSATGSQSIAANDMVLIAEELPAGTVGYFLVSPMDGFTPVVQGSQGSLCLSGPVGRLNRSSAEVFQASAVGVANVPFDTANVPTPTGPVSLLPGTTQYFQAWFRDANPNVTSNFTNGLRVTFQP